MKNLVFQSIAEAARSGESIALGIITGVQGSSPQKIGAKAVFHVDRRIEGTLGGGCLEAEAQRLALDSLKSGQPATFNLLLDHDFGWDDGLICGGRVFGVILPNVQSLGEDFWIGLAERKAARTWGVNQDFTIATSASACADWLYQETITPPCALWIAGSGHIAQAVAPLALQLDFTVTVFDDLRIGRHPRTQARRAGAGNVDSPALRVPRHDWQCAKSPHDFRALHQKQDRHGRADGASRLSCRHQDLLPKCDGNRRGHHGAIHRPAGGLGG
jgi:xanthine/CO dehydrogenase XdhC/CoxF family maturation factor